jgi:hypothetical protein
LQTLGAMRCEKAKVCLLMVSSRTRPARQAKETATQVRGRTGSVILTIFLALRLATFLV